MTPVKVLASVAIVALCADAVPAYAQDVPAIETAIGYTYLHDQDLGEGFPKGIAGSITGNITDWLGIVGEAGGNYKTVSEFGIYVKLNIYSFMAGVRFAARNNAAAVPFAQLLVGGVRASGSVLGFEASDTNLAIQPGGGVDISLTPGVGVRLQGDYRLIPTDDETSKQFRFLAGVVFRAGRR